MRRLTTLNPLVRLTVPTARVKIILSGSFHFKFQDIKQLKKDIQKKNFNRILTETKILNFLTDEQGHPDHFISVVYTGKTQDQNYF